MGYVYHNSITDKNDLNTFPLEISGVVNVPTYLFDAGDIDISECDVLLNSESDGSGSYAEHTLTNDTFTLTVGWVNNYIIADYNSGSPMLDITTDLNVINGYDIVGIFTIVTNGTLYRVTRWS